MIFYRSNYVSCCDCSWQCSICKISQRQSKLYPQCIGWCCCWLSSWQYNKGKGLKRSPAGDVSKMLNYDTWITWSGIVSGTVEVHYRRSELPQKPEARPVQSFHKRLQAWVDMAGGPFEHFIWQTFLTSSVIAFWHSNSCLIANHCSARAFF